MPAAPGHACKPIGQIDRLQCRERQWIALDLRRLERFVEGPRDLFELERTALADPALIRIREAARVHEHCLYAGGAGARERALRMCRVGQAHRPDTPVAPALLDDPRTAVKTIGAVAQIFDVGALGFPATAAVLKHDRVAVAREQ